MFIKVTDFASGIDIFVQPANIFSMHRQPGNECTVLKSVTTFEQVKETPAEIIAMTKILGGAEG